MVVYKTGTVTARATTSVDTMNYAATLTGITSDLLEDGLNHIYDATKGFYRILYVLGGTAYLSAPTKYAHGTLVRESGSNTVQKVSLASTISFVDVE
jgi:hypothetical protein